MAQMIAALRIAFDPADQQAFRADLDRIIGQYGDQPHLRKTRDAEIKRAIAVFAENCIRVQVVPKYDSLRSSSAVERAAHNRDVGGANPPSAPRSQRQRRD